MLERRKQTVSAKSDLPLDYLKTVAETFEEYFLEKLQELKKVLDARFDVLAEIYADEIIMGVCLNSSQCLSALSVFASVDFEVSQKIDPLLEACLESISKVLDGIPFLDGIQKSCSEIFEKFKAPLEWTPAQHKKYSVFIKLNKANLRLDVQAENWLRQHDPEFFDTF